MKWHRVKALLLKQWYLTRRNVDKVADIVYWPLIGLLLWGFTSIYLRAETGYGMFVTFFIGALVLWIFLQRAQMDVSHFVLEDFFSRNVYNTFASPLQTIEIFLSTAIFGFFRALFTFVILISTAWALYTFNIFTIGVVAVPFLILNLWLFGIALGLLVSGLIYRYGLQISFFAWGIAFLLQPFSAVFYPLATLAAYPGIYHIALALPSTYVFEGMRQALATGAVPWNFVAWAFVLNAIYLTGAYFVLKRFIESARKTGFLAKQA